MFRDSLNNENHFFRLSYLIVLISVILDIYYRFFVVNAYEHMGFALEIHPIKFLVAKTGLLFLLLISYLMFERSLMLYTIFLLLTFFFYLPNATLFSLSNASWKPFLSNLFFVSAFYTSVFVKIKTPQIRISARVADLILIALTLICIIPIVYSYRDRIVLSTLLLKDIYSTREVFSAKMSGGLNYLYHLSVKTILPVSLIHFLIRRKPYHVIGIFLILLYLYMISGNKIVYFNSFILILFYFFHYDYVRKLKLYFQFTIVALLIFPLFDFIFLENPILSGTFVNRFLFIPALLTQWYFDFFNGHPFYFAESHFFNHFFHSPYDMPVGYLISNTYLHTTDTYANNGVVSDGFMNLGLIGVVLFSFIVSGLFGVFHSLKLNSGYYGLYFSYIYMLLSAPLLSCFTTGGIFVFLLMAIFLLKNKQEATI